MLILCKQRDTIINLEKVQAINIHLQNRKEVCAWFDVNENNKNSVLLGEYDTEERAKEVLQEILDKYISCNEQFSPTGVGYVQNSVYKMPEN